jgi:hypothetical protein
MRHLIRALRRIETPLNVVAAVLALYLAAATAFRSAKYPSDGFWAPWDAPFVGILVAALFVPLFALLKYLDAKEEKRDKEAREGERDRALMDSDMLVAVQVVAAALARACPQVAAHDMAVQAWLCQEDGSFDRRYRFFLPYDRPRSGVTWRRGVGIAGTAWEERRDLAEDLSNLQARLRSLGPGRFDALPAPERFGMTAAQVAATGRYAGIIARRLFDQASTVRAVLVVDYTGAGEFPCLKEAVSDDQTVLQAIGACERTLNAWQDKLGAKR